jgi:hypothetical protein
MDVLLVPGSKCGDDTVLSLAAANMDRCGLRTRVTVGPTEDPLPGRSEYNALLLVGVDNNCLGVKADVARCLFVGLIVSDTDRSVAVLWPLPGRP